VLTVSCFHFNIVLYTTGWNTTNYNKYNYLLNEKLPLNLCNGNFSSYMYKRKCMLRGVNNITIITEMMDVNNTASYVWTGARGCAVG
jgi:hypothetical protein